MNNLSFEELNERMTTI